MSPDRNKDILLQDDLLIERSKDITKTPIIVNSKLSNNNNEFKINSIPVPSSETNYGRKSVNLLQNMNNLQQPLNKSNTIGTISPAASLKPKYETDGKINIDRVEFDIDALLNDIGFNKPISVSRKSRHFISSRFLLHK